MPDSICRGKKGLTTNSDGTLTKANGALPWWSQVAGILGPVVFVLVFSLFGFVSPGYSAYSRVISDLEIVQNGWIQQLNFLQCGFSIILFATGFHKGMKGVFRRHLSMSSALLLISGAGMVEAAYFTPATPVEHTIGFLFFMIPLLVAFFLVGRQFLRINGYRDLGYYSLATGLIALALLVYFFFEGASTPQGAVPTGLIGVVNRAFVIVSLAWFVVLPVKSRTPKLA